MRMTSHTDYALRMLIYLAVRPDVPCTVSDVAEAYGLSRNHLLKVAHNLSKMGLVATARGRSGGIALALPPEEINLGRLVRRMEDDFALVECLKAEGGHCRITPACRLKGVVREALDAYLAVFDRYTLADLVENADALAPLLGLSSAA
ncbi:Rrf2 family transcriptional regulator [Mesorhizobium sp. KR1-2]|uniref:Rrf2 family transcriptional regulator n=1 Tax=Mesorhizobium sp. KR1-2 TaxID=3156609 RepID=UPI0032B53F77